jgi:hypothetical protein
MLLLLLLCPPGLLSAQQSTGASATDRPSGSAAPAGSPAAAPSQQDIREVLRTVEAMRQELKDSRSEIDTLKKEVHDLREEVSANASISSGAGSLKSAVDQLHDDQEMVQSQVKTLDQTKVSTQSQYPLQVTGMILFNSFIVDGAVDNPILPLVALPRNDLYVHHSTGASLEQTQLGLSATGPKLWNAKTSADVSVDFFSYQSYTTVPPPNQMTLRLRTANVNVDWGKTQVSAGLQTPMVSLLSPTSFSTVAEPALAWSGNLWTWLPQITVEHEMAVSGSSRMVLGFGLIDPTTQDITNEQLYGLLRKSTQPGYEGRVSYQWGNTQRPYEISANGYYTRQAYYGSQADAFHSFDFWAGTADWRVPVTRFAELSGEFYRGRGIGDLGGGAFKNVVGSYTSGVLNGLDATGGWAQMKFHLTGTLEANAFFGEDSANAGEIRAQGTPMTFSPYLDLVKNQSTAANLIFRPKTYLVFSGEYRNMRSWYSYGYGNAKAAENLGLTMGYIF